MELFGIVFSIPVAFVTSMRHTQDAARAAGVRLQPVEARTASEIDSAFAAITKERAGAVIVLIDSLLPTYVDKILKGAKAAELPVEQPVTFELVINLGTAKNLRLTIPPAVLQRADRAIQ